MYNKQHGYKTVTYLAKNWGSMNWWEQVLDWWMGRQKDMQIVWEHRLVYDMMSMSL
jgi:hypothetical protein